MYWVVQEDLFRENRRAEITETLTRFAIPYQTVTFNSERKLTPDVVQDGPIITNGSVLLSKIATERGWQPGSMLTEAFSYSVWHPILRDHLLNKEAVFATVRDANPQWDRFFMRPLQDTKAFNGRVIGINAFRLWQQNIVSGIDMRISPETMMLYSPVKTVGQEFRNYIVDGEVVSASRYKLNGQPCEAEVHDVAITRFAEDMAAKWSPARAFVLDTYVTGDVMGIVEMGCICHAGLYRADVQKIVMALDGMVL